MFSSCLYMGFWSAFALPSRILKARNRNNNKGKAPATRKPAPAPRPNQPRVNQRPSNQRVKPTVHLSQCATDYARCIINPFTGPIACIPDFPVHMSRKAKVFARGNFSTGTTGFGFITHTPAQMAARDQTAGFFSTNAYTGTTVECSASTTGVSYYRSNSEYTNSMFVPAQRQDQLDYRVVASGLRIKYTGTELNRGGLAYVLQEPTHDSLQGVSISTLGQQVEMKQMTIGREWLNVLYRPVKTRETEYTNRGTTSGVQSDMDDAFYYNTLNFMAILVQAPSAAVEASYAFEAYTVLEYTGAAVRGLTASHFDPTGYSAVHAASQTSEDRHPFTGEAQKKERSFVSTVEHYLSQAISWIGEHSGQLASAASAVMAMF